MTKMLRGVVLALMVAVTGCIDYDEALVINEDGSGTIHMRFVMDNTYLRNIEEMTGEFEEETGEQVASPDDEEVMFTREEIEESLAASGGKITLLSYEEAETEQSRTWDMKFKFADIDNLGHLTQTLSPEDEEEEDTVMRASEETEFSYSQQSDGTWLYERSLDQGGGGSDLDFDDAHFGYEAEEEAEVKDAAAEADDDVDDAGAADDEAPAATSEGAQDEADLEDMSKMMEGMFTEMQRMMEELGKHKLRFEVTFPGRIVESNATSTEGNTAVWEYNLMEMSGASQTQRAVIAP